MQPVPLTFLRRNLLFMALLAISTGSIIQAEQLALVNGVLLDPETERPIRAVLLLEDGRVKARVKALPTAYQGLVVDLGGRFVSPGLFDLHVHSFGNTGPRGGIEVFGVEGTAERMISVGVTGFLDLSSYEDDTLAIRDEQRRAWTSRVAAIGADADSDRSPALGWLGADIYSAGAAFTCPEGHGTQFPNPAHEVSSPAEARLEVERLASKQPDVIKLIYLASHPTYPSIDRATMQAIIDAAHSHGIKVVAHTSFWADALEVVRAGADAITHTDAAEVPAELLTEMKRRGTAIIPTLAVHLDLSYYLSQGSNGDQEPSRKLLEERVSLAEFRSAYNDQEAPLSERLERWRTRQLERRHGYLTAVKTLSDAGVVVLTGSDSGNPGTFQGASLHRELRLLEEAGLTPWQALKAATSNAGRFLGLSVGFEVGDLANFAIYNASPVESMVNSETVAMVIHHGRVVDMERLDIPGKPPVFEPNARDLLNDPRGSPTISKAPPNSPKEELEETVDDGLRRPAGGSLVSGIVAAPSGYRLSHVEVGLRTQGSTSALVTVKTDADGHFEFIEPIPSEVDQTAGLEVVASYPGFDPVLVAVERNELPKALTLTMQVSRFQEAIVVEAISPTDEALQPQQEFGFLDIVATAGANADPLFAAQTLPGVVKLDDGSGLFVRGGDTSEVATFLDRALLDHPYRNETPTGGFFGTVDAFELEGLSLSAGGFPARYGNTLSAVLELRTRAPRANKSVQATIGLGAVALSVESGVGTNDDARLRLATNYRDATALVDLNNSKLDFAEPPKGTDYSARLSHQSSDRHSFSVSAYHQDASIGTELENGNFVGTVDSADRDRVVMAAWESSFGDASTWLTLSGGDHQSDLLIGALEIASEDRTWRGRGDLEWLQKSWLLRTGGVVEQTDYRASGTLPQVSGDFGGDQGQRVWRSDASSRRQGVYVEGERPLGQRAAFNLGLRYDRWQLLDEVAFDPRASFSVRAGRSSHLRVAWGRYHQEPALEYLTQTSSVDSLEAGYSEHRVLSWQWRDASDPLQLRVELYDKRYSKLPLEVIGQVDVGPSYVSTGFGSAKGGDVYLGFRTDDTGPSLESGWRGFVAYSYLEAERLATPWQDSGRYRQPSAPFAPDFAIPHTVQLVLHKALPFAVSGSIGFRYATGRPSTPVLAAEPREDGSGVFDPVYGPINSDRLPDFYRVDLSASRAFGLGGTSSLLGFVGINDLFDRRNAFRYVYSRDWSERREARTAFGRTVYFGVSIQR